MFRSHFEIFNLISVDMGDDISLEIRCETSNKGIIVASYVFFGSATAIEPFVLTRRGSIRLGR